MNLKMTTTESSCEEKSSNTSKITYFRVHSARVHTFESCQIQKKNVELNKEILSVSL